MNQFYICTYLYFLRLFSHIGHYWSRKWQPTPVSLPGKFHGQRSLAGYSRTRLSDWAHTQSLQSIEKRPDRKIGFCLTHGLVWMDFKTRCWKNFLEAYRRSGKTIFPHAEICKQRLWEASLGGDFTTVDLQQESEINTCASLLKHWVILCALCHTFSTLVAFFLQEYA